MTAGLVAANAEGVRRNGKEGMVSEAAFHIFLFVEEFCGMTEVEGNYSCDSDSGQ